MELARLSRLRGRNFQNLRDATQWAAAKGVVSEEELQRLRRQVRELQQQRPPPAEEERGDAPTARGGEKWRHTVSSS